MISGDLGSSKIYFGLLDHYQEVTRVIVVALSYKTTNSAGS
jgi:hypothetical protein